MVFNVKILEFTNIIEESAAWKNIKHGTQIQKHQLSSVLLRGYCDIRYTKPEGSTCSALLTCATPNNYYHSECSIKENRIMNRKKICESCSILMQALTS